MNDLEILDHVFEPLPPSRAAHAQARAALLERAQPRRRRRRAPLRVTAVATAAAIAAAFVVVVQNLGDSPRALPLASADVFERAAHAAETKPFTPPRPHQWIYIEDRMTSSDGSTLISRWWHRADGGGTAIIERGGVRVDEGPPNRKRPRGPFESYEAAAALPRDPDALLRWAYREAGNVEGAGLTEDGDVYAILSGLLGRHVLPPDLEAGIFRALKRVPGVTVSTVDVMGERVISLAQTEDWLREELFLDPETYGYRGRRGTVVHDTVVSPEKAGNATGRIQQGHTATSIRLRTAIVDQAGER